jgi:elongation factor 2
MIWVDFLLDHANGQHGEKRMSRRVKMTDDILALMKNPAQIRNIGLVGHVDHGKTTLSDSLIAEAGLLSESLAGEARVLDYLEEEQRRGITMKSANISLYYDQALKNSAPFLINLVDTPGHVDFTGKVTRALRLIDGVVVIVDAVEEVSAQTETVLRQSLEEAARPLLFINKIDRLFRELKLSMDEIKTKFNRIIQNFNSLIQMYADDAFKEKWQVSAEAGTVIFGSALHRWGFVIPQLLKKQVTLSLFAKKYENDSYKELVSSFPVWEAVLASVVQFLPNPKVAQQYRIGKIWSGDLNSDLGKAMQSCDPNGPLVMCLSKVEKFKDRLVGTGRIFSGTLTRTHEVYLLGEKNGGSLTRLSLFMGSRLENVDQLPAGNIAAIVGLKYVRSGETIVDSTVREIASPFEAIKYVSEPVITVAVEPDMLKNLNQLQDILEEIKIEDPNITVDVSDETGECLVSGIGPLHLETIASAIKDRGVEVTISKPSSVFRESVEGISSYHEATSPNGLNKINLLVMRLDNQTVKFFRTIKSSVLTRKDLREQTVPEQTGLSLYEVKGWWNLDSHQNLVLSRLPEDTGIEYDEELYEKSSNSSQNATNPPNPVDTESKSKRAKKKDARLAEKQQTISDEARTQILESLRALTNHGILAQEPLSELKIVIRDIQLAPNREDSNYFELSTMIRDAFMACIHDAKPTLLEPIYKLLITTPEEYIGTVSSLVNQFQGRITEINQDAFRTYIQALMSVRKTIELSTELRAQSSGRVFWQTTFDKYQPVPENQREEIIKEIKFRKGLIFS